jgi:large subunit ribosomal protein L10
VVKKEKIAAVEKLRKILEENQLIGFADLYKMPTKQLQEIRKQIRGKGQIIVTKKSIVLHALREVQKQNLQEFEKMLPQQPAIIVSNQEPFKFYLFISKMKSPTYAKAGDAAEEDIVVSAGPTNLLPGPVISELTKLGIPAGVEEGKIAIKKDKVVATKGTIISKELASVLRKLNIKPINIGLKIVALYKDGEIFQKEVLDLVGEKYITLVLQAHQRALNLSVAVGYPTRENIKLLLAKAYRTAKVIENKLGVQTK